MYVGSNGKALDLFILLRNLSVDDAQAMLVDTLRFRKTVNIDDLMGQKVARVTAVQFGRDKTGRPVLFVLFARGKCSIVAYSSLVNSYDNKQVDLKKAISDEQYVL